MTWFGRVIDKAGKWLSRLKTIGFVVLLIFFGLSVFKHGCDRQEMADLLHRTTGLNLENDILHNHVAERDSLLEAKQDAIKNLEDAIDRSENRVKTLANRYLNLYNRFNKLADSIITIPVDSSYLFLNRTAYPYGGEKRFPFSEPQVKGIHLTWLERLSLSDMNTSLSGRIAELNDQLLLKDSVKLVNIQKMVLMEQSTQDMEQIIENKDEIIDGQDDYIHQTKKKNRVIQWIAGGIIAILAILAAGGG